MPDLNKVISGLEHCRKYGALGGNDCSGHYMLTDEFDITRLEEHRHDCPYGKCKTGCVVTLVEDAVELLKKHNRPDCEHAEHDGAGCLGYSGCSQDDEPIDACKNCDRYTGNIVREW